MMMAVVKLKHVLVACSLIFSCRNQQIISCYLANQLDGVHLEVAVTQNPPWDTVIPLPNGTLIYHGTTREMITWLSKKLNFTCTFVYPSEEASRIGAKAAGLNLIIKKEADLTAFSNTNTPDRRKLMDFVGFLSWQDDYRLITPKPIEVDRLFAFARPFHATVWLMIGISLIATVSVMSISKILIGPLTAMKNNQSKIDEKTLKNTEKECLRDETSVVKALFTYIMYVINTLTNHGDFNLNELSIPSFFTVVFFWLVGVSVIVYGYSSIIVSSLTSPKLNPSINSYEDLVASTNVRLLIISDMSHGQAILRGDNDIYKKLAEKAKRYPESVTNNYDTRDALLLTGTYAHAHLETFSRSFVANLYNKEKKCRFELSDPLRQPSYNNYFMALAKGSPYTDAVTAGLMQLWETGLSRYWTYSPIPRADECFKKKKRSDSQRTLNIEDFTGAFLILGIGLSLSLVVFIAEVFCSLHLKRPKR